MNIILLSGGSGKRLWPLSNDIRSKQFLKLFPSEKGYESMIQRVYAQIQAVDANAVITIATSKKQVSAIHNQLGDKVGICIEPCRRDTFPAIALAVSYLHEIKEIKEEEVVVVIPVDPYVDEDYFEAIKQLSHCAKDSNTNLTLMGIRPTYPSEKYGYILPDSDSDLSPVKGFTEKPTKELAENYIQNGALWNSGIFAFKLGYLLKQSQQLLGCRDYQDLFNQYAQMKSISFDYAVVEKEPSIQVMRFSGKWCDLGTWNMLTDAMTESSIGEAIISKTCDNVHIVNDLDIPILAMGLHDVVISASPDGILVSDKEQSSFIKPYVDTLSQKVMIAEKSWGGYRVINVEDESLTIRVNLKSGYRMSYHSHKERDEVWVVIGGKGKTIIDGMEQKIQAGDVITMQAGCRHTVIAKTELKLIEVQIGREISAQDKQKYELEE